LNYGVNPPFYVGKCADASLVIFSIRVFFLPPSGIKESHGQERGDPEGLKLGVGVASEK